MSRLFTTDGIRDVANTGLSCEIAMATARAAATVLSDGNRRRPIFLVATDTRISGPMLQSAVVAGLCSVGADAWTVGVISTPAVAYLTGRFRADAGIVLTASHNSFEYNGIKIFSADGHKLPDALEEQIEELVLSHKPFAADCQGDRIGRVCDKSALAQKEYVSHLKKTIPESLDGMRIAVDCANGAAGATAGRLFSELGADAVLLNAQPDGINVNAGCGSTHIEGLQEYVKKGGFDAGFAFDGDADRCLAVDENGEVFDGDMIMAACAADMQKRGKLNKNTVVGTVMTNLGFCDFCAAQGLEFVATGVGDRYVLEQMLQNEYSFGGEQSGHIIFGDYATTGDGQLTAIQLLSLLRRQGKKLSELRNLVQRYAQTMLNVRVSDKGKLAFYTDPEIKAAVEAAKSAPDKNGRVLVRVSGTEPLIRIMVEGRDADTAQKTAQALADLVKARLEKL